MGLQHMTDAVKALEKLEKDFEVFASACIHDLEILREESDEIRQIANAYEDQISDLELRIRAVKSLITEYKSQESGCRDEWCNYAPCTGKASRCEMLSERARLCAKKYMCKAIRDLSPGEKLIMSDFQLIGFAQIFLESSDTPPDILDHITLEMWREALEQVRSDINFPNPNLH